MIIPPCAGSDIGPPGSRYEINTPALILDLDRLEHNLAAMADAMKAAGKALRPHIKSHKCSQLAMRQRDHGAIGICCATLDEAEVMASEGLHGILITSPITTPQKIARLMALLQRAPETMIAVDNPSNLKSLSAATQEMGVVANLLVDIELGFGRTGVTSIGAAITMAEAVKTLPGVHFAGLQAYGGHLQHIRDAGQRQAAAGQAGQYIGEIVAGLRATGIEVPLVSGGGTGTHAIDGAGTWFTEIQAGSYPLMDADYGAVSYAYGRPWPFAAALLVQTSVISCNVPGTVTVDSGTKAIATNGPPPEIVTPGFQGATFEFSGDEHGRIRLAPGNSAPDIGERLELVASHCDPTVALHDIYHCVRGDRLVDLWRIDARGRG